MKDNFSVVATGSQIDIVEALRRGNGLDDSGGG